MLLCWFNVIYVFFLNFDFVFSSADLQNKFWLCSHYFFLFLLKLPNSHSNFHIFWQRLWIQIKQLSDLRTLKALENREELENLDLSTMNALFNEKDQFPDLNGLREPITKIQRVKLRINGFMLDSKFYDRPRLVDRLA